MKLGALIPTLVIIIAICIARLAGVPIKWWWALGVLVCGGVATIVAYKYGLSWLEK